MLELQGSLASLASSKTMHIIKLLLFLTFFCFESTCAVKFAFNGFNTSDMLLYGTAKLDSSAISLTRDTTFSVGRALYPFKIPTRLPNSPDLRSFKTSFTFTITPYKNKLPGHGLVFIFVPSPGIEGAAPAQHLGFLNRTNNGNPNNYVFGIEFDVFKNQEFNDINDNHVGLNLNSLDSLAASEAGYWSEKDTKNKGNNTNLPSFKGLKLNNGETYRVWIEYDSANFLSVTMAPLKMKKPRRALMESLEIDLSEVFHDEMYVGFCAATGQLIENHKILSWRFSN